MPLFSNDYGKKIFNQSQPEIAYVGVGCFPSSKQNQLKDLEKTIHVLKAYVAKPLV
jgi:hypothetical protein